MLKGKIRDRSELKVWAEYKDGFALQIRHTTRAHSQNISQRCRKQTWSNEIGGYESSVDTEKLYDAFAREIIADWRGLTPAILRTLVDMESYPESDVPYSPEDAAELLKKVHGLDLWVQTIARNLDHYETERRAAEIKNS